MTSHHPTGWHHDPAAITGYIRERLHANDVCTIGGPFGALPELKGFWRQTVLSGVYAVLPYVAELDVLGEYLPADYQRSGTCVSRGTYRAVQTGYWHAIATRKIGAKAERIAYEPIYAGSRVNVGGGALGRSDGSIGAWAAKWVHDFGVIPRGVYDDVDLSRDQEQWAVNHGMPGTGVPRTLYMHGATHQCDSYHVADANDLADVTAAEYCSAICSTHQQSNQRDQNGECGYLGSTAHCEAIVGVYLRQSWDGRPESIYDHTGFVDQQSWGNTPSGPDTLRFYKGDTKLRQGAYGTPMAALRKRIVTGETWAFRLREGWREKTLAEAVR